MAHRLHPLVPLALATALAAASVSACGGGEPSRTSGGAGGVSVAGLGYTADRLAQALLPDVAGYRRNGDPDLGEYGSLRAVRNAARLQEGVTLDKPRCADGAAPAGNIPANTPAALITFTAKNGWTATETLMGMSADAAAAQVDVRVPSACRTFTTEIDEKPAKHHVAEAPGGGIGQGSRTVGVTTVAAKSRTTAWYVVFRGRDYLATVSVVGPKATRAEAERIAREASEQADRILP